MGPWPVHFILVFVAILSDHRHRAIGDKTYKNEDNIGTVLFEKNDCGRHCWSTEEVVLLNSRRMFQDILPKVNVINCQNDQYIALLMDYFHICLECVRKLSIGKTKHLMLKALADTMGGYLKVYILPLTKHSYYAGNIKYHNAKRLFELFEELKNFLHTNGDGWRSPKNPGPNLIKIPPIVVTPSKSPSACAGLLTYPAPLVENGARPYPAYNFKKKRLAHRMRRHRRRSATEHGGSSQSAITVPLPFLDDDLEPNSIALPFRKENLQSLNSENSAFALVKYYVASIKCIGSKSSNPGTSNQLEGFRSDLYQWLRKTVTPHLEDDKWYPAFGGVLRVMASLKESGYGSNRGKSGGGEYQMIPQFITETMSEQALNQQGVLPLYGGGRIGLVGVSNSVSFGTTELVVIALASALLVWLFVGLSLVCYRFLRKNSEEYKSTKDPSIAVLYGNEDFCTDDACPSRNLRKGLVEKLKEWWKRKFRECSGSCDRCEDEERCLASVSYSSKDTLAATGSKLFPERQYNKAVSVSRSTSPRERRSCRKAPYTSDEFSTNSDSPT